MDSTSGSRRVVDKTTRTLLHRLPQPSPAVSLEKGPSVSSPLPPLLLPQSSGPPRLTKAARTCPPSQCRRCVRARPGQEAVPIGQDGEERHAKSRAGRQGEDGSCRTTPQTEAPQTKADSAQQQLSLWGEACDEDVSDVTDKLGVLLYEIGELEDQYVDRYDQYRVTVKSIRNIEASVQPSRDSESPFLRCIRLLIARAY